MSSRLSPPFEFKAADVTATGEFSGYASTFGGPPDAYGDIIAEGAFTKSLDAHQAAGTKPALLWAHDATAPIGRWLNLHEDAKGLAVTGQLTLGVEKAREAHALMRDGALGLSIGYRVLDDDYARDGTRMVKAVELWEISAVAMPANARAQILQVRSRPVSLHEWEQLIRELPVAPAFSVRQARRLATRGWPPIGEAETDDARLDYWIKHFRS